MKKLILASLLIITNAFAQLPQNWSPNFAAPEVNGQVLAVAESADAYYIGGVFTRVGNVQANAIARIDKTTGAASALGSGMINGPQTGSVAALAVVGTDVYAAGTFDTAGGVAASRIAKWNGTSWSAMGSGANSSVQEMAVMGTDLIVAGAFTFAGGVTGANRLARWNGTAWSVIGSTGANNTVSGLLVDGTDLYVCGSFTSIGGVTAARAAKWDGSSWSALGAGLNSTGTCIAKLGSDVYFGGVFTTAGGIASPRVARWDGNAWFAAAPNIPNPQGYVGATINTLAVMGGHLYAGGGFNGIHESTVGSYVTRWDGSAWSPVAGDTLIGTVNQLLPSGSSVIAVGTFTTPFSRIARFDGTAWQSMLETVGQGLDSDGYSIVELNGKIYVSGNFTHVGALEANHVACYDKPTNTWTALPSSPGGNLIAHNGELYAYYWVDEPAPPYHFNVAKLTGTSWTTIGTLEGTSMGTPASIGGSLYIVGNFSSVNGTPINHIAKWNGTTWSDAGAGITLNADSMVQSICQVGSQLYASTFNNELVGVDWIQTSHILQWNGSAWVTHTSNINPSVSCMIAMGNDLVIGGYFDSINGVPCDNHVARWNGTTWSALGTGVLGSVNVLKYTHGLLYAGTQVDNEFLREWNGSTWEEVGGGPNYDVWDIAVLGDELFITGSFTEAGSNITDGEGIVSNLAISSSYIGSYPLTPEIAIEQPVNTNLVDGSASIDFGTAPQGSSLTALTFTLRSTGTIPLLNLGVTKDGANSSDFTISALPTVLEDNTSTTFTVTFTPSATGTRSAVIHIASNDADESPFDITLSGTGTPASGSIDEWRQFWFGTTSNTGSAADTADDDKDGVPNLMEFGLGLNPTLPSVPVFQTQINGNNLEFTYTRSTAAVLAGRTFQVPWTQTLNGTDWNYADTTQTVLTDNGTFQTVKATVPKGSSGRRFVRLEVQ